jgi:23S rRNA pseudouridine2605 synthase/16S rRNA pseudouridine516 synthase
MTYGCRVHYATFDVTVVDKAGPDKSQRRAEPQRRSWNTRRPGRGAREAAAGSRLRGGGDRPSSTLPREEAFTIRPQGPDGAPSAALDRLPRPGTTKAPPQGSSPHAARKPRYSARPGPSSQAAHRRRRARPPFRARRTLRQSPPGASWPGSYGPCAEVPSLTSTTGRHPPAEGHVCHSHRRRSEKNRIAEAAEVDGRSSLNFGVRVDPKTAVIHVAVCASS